MQKLSIHKAVIPVAGLGTRMLPASKSIPKEMLPIVDKPIIQYIVEECAAAGITQIVFVTHASKNSIENHFDHSFELESTLEKRVKRQLLEEMQGVCPEGVTLLHVRQGEAKGLGHAVNCAAAVVGGEPFAVILPDVLIDPYCSDHRTDNLADMVRCFNETQISQILVEQVEPALIEQYGIVDCVNLPDETHRSVALKSIVEKPAKNTAPSNLAVVGRYIFHADIWPFLSRVPLGAGGEIQLTDAIAMLLEKQRVNAYLIKGKSHDCGNKIGYLNAFAEYAAQHPQFGTAFKTHLKTLL